jgi:hypothetical protein
MERAQLCFGGPVFSGVEKVKEVGGKNFKAEIFKILAR